MLGKEKTGLPDVRYFAMLPFRDEISLRRFLETLEGWMGRVVLADERLVAAYSDKSGRNFPQAQDTLLSAIEQLEHARRSHRDA